MTRLTLQLRDDAAIELTEADVNEAGDPVFQIDHDTLLSPQDLCRFAAAVFRKFPHVVDALEYGGEPFTTEDGSGTFFDVDVSPNRRRNR